MARFKDFSHGLNTHSMERVAHIRPAHWDYRMAAGRHHRPAGLKKRAVGDELEMEKNNEVNPALIDPKALVASPLMRLYMQFRNGCSNIL